MLLMGTYYREWLSSEHLLSPQGCGDVERVYIHADTDQRTLETSRALAETLLPGCTVTVHSAPEGSRDPLFSASAAGAWRAPDGNSPPEPYGTAREPTQSNSWTCTEPLSRHFSRYWREKETRL